MAILHSFGLKPVQIFPQFPLRSASGPVPVVAWNPVANNFGPVIQMHPAACPAQSDFSLAVFIPFIIFEINIGNVHDSLIVYLTDTNG